MSIVNQWSGRVLRHLGVAVAAIAAVGCFTAPALAAPAVNTETGWHTDPEVWGVNDAPLEWSLTNEQLATHVAAINKLGARWVRFAINWPRIQEAGRGTFRWAEADFMIARLALYGLRWRPVALDVPPWLRVYPSVNTRQPPSSSEPIAEFLDAFLDRYGPGGTLWRDYPWIPAHPVLDLELHNEPNHVYFWGFDPSTWAWRTDHTGARWGELYGSALDTVAAEHPGVRMWMGGLAIPAPAAGAGTPAATFMRNAFEAHPSLRTTLAGVALHTYPNSSGSWQVAAGHVAGAVAAMRAYGRADMQVQLNEYGASKVNVPNESDRTGFVAGMTDLARSDCPIAGLAPYTLFSREQYDTYAGDWYGLVQPSTGELNPTGAAYATKVSAYNAGTVTGSEQHLCGP